MLRCSVISFTVRLICRQSARRVPSRMSRSHIYIYIYVYIYIYSGVWAVESLTSATMLGVIASGEGEGEGRLVLKGEAIGGRDVK